MKPKSKYPLDALDSDSESQNDSISLKSDSGGSSWGDDSNHDLTLPPSKREKGEFVAVRYDDKIFPGIVIEVLLSGAMVKAMQSNGRLWKWPEKEDILFYDWADILGRISPPTQFSSRRELFSVPELNDHY